MRFSTATGRVSLWALLGALLVPLIVAGGFLAATWDAQDRLDRVQAAIVNNDEPVTLDGQYVPLGRQLSGGLVRGQEGSENVTWVLTDSDGAQDGLREGTYSAIVTIPPGFSAAATSAGGDPNEARQATIDVVTSPNSPVADPVIAALVTQAATDTLNRTLTESSLDAIYVGLNQLGDGFRQSADGAGQLADGTEELAAGAGQAASGTWTLADGMGQLSDGGAQLAAGGAQLSAGANQLAAGSGQFATGLQQYTSGVSQLNSGMGQLSTGLTALDQGLASTGSMDVAQLQQLDAGAQSLATGSTGLAAGMTDLSTGLGGLATGAHGIDDGLGQYQAGMQSIATDGLVDPDTGTPVCPADVAALGPDYCDVFTAGTKAGAGAAVAGLNQQGPGGEPSLLQGSAALAAGADQSVTGAQQLAAASGALAAGAQELSGGITTLVAALVQLPAQQAVLAAAVHQLALGAGQLAAGSAQLDANGPLLTSGAQQLAGGAQQFATGVGQYTAGVGQYTDGVSLAASGTRQLATGMDQLESGTRQVAEGNRQLADGLAEGAAQAPNYSESERDRLATVMARPVAAGDTDLQTSLVTGPALLLVISLWLGGLATFVALRAIGGKGLTETTSSIRLAARTMLPGAAIGAAQAAAITAIGQAYLGLPADQAWKCLGVLLLAGVTFAAVNQALVAWLGGAGRVISVTLAVLTAAGALVSATPSFFASIHSFLPLSPAIAALRSIVSDESGAGSAVLLLACWLAVAVAAILIRVIRSREVTADRLIAQFA